MKISYELIDLDYFRILFVLSKLNVMGNEITMDQGVDKSIYLLAYLIVHYKNIDQTAYKMMSIIKILISFSSKPQIFSLNRQNRYPLLRPSLYLKD